MIIKSLENAEKETGISSPIAAIKRVLIENYKWVFQDEDHPRTGGLGAEDTLATILRDNNKVLDIYWGMLNDDEEIASLYAFNFKLAADVYQDLKDGNYRID